MYIDAGAVRGEFQEKYIYSRDFWAPFVKDAQVYTLAAAGYTWSDDERKELIAAGREPIEYNIIRRPLEFFSGYLRDNIKQIIYAPVEGSDQKTADQFTKLGYYFWDKSKGYNTFLGAGDECFKSGISLFGLQMDYSRDFINGEPSFYKRTYNAFYLDPTFEAIDLSDCEYGITRDLVGKQYIKQLIPFVDPEYIDDLPIGFRDDKFMQYHPQFQTFSRNRNLIAYDQYYSRVTKTRKFLIDKRSSHYRDITDLSKEEKDKLKHGIGRFERLRYEADELGIDPDDIPDMEIRSVDRGFVDLHILLNGECVYKGPDKTGIDQTFPFVPLIAYMEPSIWMPSIRIQGIPACNYSLQRQFNKRHMKITDMMDSDIATGWKYMIGSVSDPQDLQQSGQNKLVGIDPENAPYGMDSVQQLQGGGTNPALIEYQSVLDKLSLTLSNVTESVMGVDEGGNTQISGRLAEVRIAQGLRGNRKIMDNIEAALEIAGALLLKVIQTHCPPGKVERILAEQPTDQFYERDFEQYDAVIKEGIRSKSQKDAYYYELVNLKREGIVDVPQSEIVRALSMAGLSDLEESIEKQDEMLSQQAALEMEFRKKEMDKLDSEAEANKGLSQERKSRVISNLSLKDERESEAQQNIAQAALDRARTITEIAKLHDDRILEVLRFVNELEDREAEGREAQKAQVSGQAHQINTETEGSSEFMAQQQAQQMMQSQQSIMNDINQGG